MTSPFLHHGVLLCGVYTVKYSVFQIYSFSQDTYACRSSCEFYSHVLSHLSWFSCFYHRNYTTLENQCHDLLPDGHLYLISWFFIYHSDVTYDFCCFFFLFANLEGTGDCWLEIPGITEEWLDAGAGWLLIPRTLTNKGPCFFLPFAAACASTAGAALSLQRAWVVVKSSFKLA